MKIQSVVLYSFLALSLHPASSVAEPIDEIVVGVEYYISGFFWDTKSKVIAVDKNNNRVKIHNYKENEIRWVQPHQILNTSDSIKRDWKRAETILKAWGALDEAFSQHHVYKGYEPPSNFEDSENEPDNWVPGTPHAEYDNIVSSSEQGKWKPKPGYTWEDSANSWTVVWSPGRAHPEFKHVVADKPEGSWRPSPGYAWRDPGSSWDVTWTPGINHPTADYWYASDQEGKWLKRKFRIGLRFKTLQEYQYKGKIYRNGLEVVSLIDKAPAAQAGLKSGDIIFYANKKHISRGKDLIDSISESNGKSLKIFYVRDDTVRSGILKPERLSK